MFDPIPTRTYICLVRRRDGLCDELLEQRHGRRFDVRPARLRVDCVLPIG